MKSKKTRLVLTKKVLITLLILLSLALIKCIFSLSVLFVNSNQSSSLFTYTNDSHIDYNVYINKNGFIEESVLPANKNYITNLVKNINMNMTYNYIGEIYSPIKYQHEVVADLIVKYNEDPTSDDNPIIWEKEFIIKPLNNLTKATEKKFTINETFNIDIEKYNTLVKDFRNHFSLPTISYLDIKMPITLSGKDDKFAVEENYNVVATIPLDKDVFSIDAMLDKKESKSARLLSTKTSNLPMRQVTLYGVLIVAIISLIIIILSKLNYFKHQEVYEIYLKKIKEDYNDIVVETNNMIDMSKLKKISISDFDELLNLSNSLMLPIMMFVGSSASYFYILKDEIVYFYLYRKDKNNTKNK